MRAHTRIRRMLYDYLVSELPEEESALVERHLSVCKRCSSVLEDLQQTLEMTSRRAGLASDERPEEFWDSFSERITSKILERRGNHAISLPDFLADVPRVLVLRWRYIAAFSGALIILIGFLLTNRLAFPPDPEVAADKFEEHVSPYGPEDDIGQYLRKSGALLVGLTNMKAPEGNPLDLSTERVVSRELLRESRVLHKHSLDPHAVRLIGDIEKVLIELANVNHGEQKPNLEIIRGGIYEQNLLFKIRMAQANYEAVRLVSAREKDIEGDSR